MDAQGDAPFEPYLPRLVRDWAARTPAESWRELDGSLVSVDLSGFTALAERLQARGRAGAEELVLAISGVFEGLIGIANRRGGDVLKFRGDALLILFSGDAHAERACRAASEMQWFIERTGETMSSVGEVRLRMSTGIYTGVCHFFLVESSHKELVIAGPAATATIRLEDEADAGEVLVSPATAASVGPEWLAGERGGAALLALDREPDALAPPVVQDADRPGSVVDLEPFVPIALRSSLRLEAGEAEHRQVTAAFVKFAGVEALLAQRGPAGVGEALDVLGAVVGRVTSELGLTWLESDIDVDGGKLYLAAGAPSTTGADEERMLRALRAILDEGSPLTLRAGVHRGPAFAGDIGASTRRTYAVMGDTVNLAARLAARAEPGEILATAEVLERSPTRFETAPQPFLVKGKERAITAYSVGVVTGVAEEERAQELPIIGREQELAELEAAVAATRLRQGQVAELVGEPGIGKSRLVDELKTMTLGFTQLVAHCDQYGMSVPYLPFRSLLRPLAGIIEAESPAEAGDRLKPWIEAVMPEFAPWLPLLAIPFDAEVPMTPETEEIEPAFRRERLFKTVEEFLLRVLVMPTLIVFEDTHWIDDASHSVLLHLVRSSVPRPWLVAITRRPQGLPFVDEPGGGHRVLELSALPGEETARLALAAAGEVAFSEELLSEVSERSGGNPLFVRELVVASRAEGGVATLPETVETLITTRIDTLEPGDRFLLRNASVLGARFELDLLADVLADELEDVGDLDRWRRLGEFVIWEGTNELRFRHDLFRTVAYEGLSFRRRREIHGRVGTVLESHAEQGSVELAPLLSLHFLHAEDYERAWRYSVAVGELAQHRFANVDAAELFQRALTAAEHLELPPLEVAHVAEALGDVCELAARYEEAGDAYRHARELVADGLVQSRLMRKEGILRERLGSYPEALDWYGRGLKALDDSATGSNGLQGRVQLELATAGVKYRQGHFDEGIHWSSQAAEHAELADDRAALGHAYFLLHLNHISLGEKDDEHARLALPMLEEAGNLVLQSNVVNNLGIEAYYAGRWDEASELYRQSGELSERVGDVVNVARAQNNEGEIVSDQGKLEEAEELFLEARRVWRAARYPVGIALATSNLGRVAARTGRFDEALEFLAEALTAFEALGSEAFGHETQARRAESFVLAGRYQEALDVAPTVLEAAGENRLLYPFLERLHGYALVQARRPDEARPRFERSLELARELDADYEVAMTLEALGRTRLGEPGSEAESKAILERLGVVSTPRVPLP
jgi:class 3 adenylate cyclase/tetratricopeptide (TPR) repeat protein